MSKIFLGGSRSDWRSKMIPQLTKEYYTPNVNSWSIESESDELSAMDECNIHLYYIDSRLRGFTSIAEMIQSSNKPNVQTVIVINTSGFTPLAVKSLKYVTDIAKSNGAKVMYNPLFDNIASYLNSL